MTPHFIHADARSLPLADGCVQCAVTSPPYFALRDYGIAGQIGLESSLDAYLAAMVGVFREVHRVLRPDGVAFLNIGDTYAGSWGAQSRGDFTPGTLEGASSREACLSARQIKAHPKGTHTGSLKRSGLKSKDLMGVPWRLALALQADGWYLRADIIWAKPNPMPESVTDRPTKAHEYIFLLTKSERYYWDAEAIKEESTGKGGGASFGSVGNADAALAAGQQARRYERPDYSQRNARSVWTMTTRSCPEAHFATFPIDLPLRCIKAGTSERGACPHCGAPWRRVIEKIRPVAHEDGATASAYAEGMTANRLALLRQAARARGEEYVNRVQTTGWARTCKCPAHEPIPCTVFDPFNGAGTTGLAAYQLGRRYVGTELNPEYIAISGRRFVAFAAKLATQRQPRPRKPKPAPTPILAAPAPTLFSFAGGQ